MCQPSGYYAWVDRPLSLRAREELRLELEIRAADQRTRQTYGPARLQHDLAEHDVRVGICRIRRIRKKLGIRCKQKRKLGATTHSKHKLPVAENLLKQELVNHRHYGGRWEAIREIREYIEIFYNRQRCQARLGFLSPAAYAQRYYAGQLAA